MKNSYAKPIVLENESLAEGVYAASGNNVDNQDTQSTNDNDNGGRVCDSIYIRGNYIQPDFSDWANGTNLNGRGCEGCPACWSDGKCHVESYEPQEDCRPSWEKEGKAPDAKWNQ